MRVLKKTGEVLFREAKNVAIHAFLTILPEKSFTFRNEKLPYLYHKYNTTWANERAVEIPIAMSFVKHYAGKRILEVGNTLNHYFFFPHDVVDKYEKAEGVINIDVVDFQPHEKYDFIISVSTMEHVGWDEEPREPEKVLAAFKKLVENCLAPSGKIVATMPIGYNLELDKFLKDGQIRFTKEYFVGRVSKDNRWEEIRREEALKLQYGNPFPNANAIVIGILQN